MISSVKACYMIRGTDSNGGVWMTREPIWQSCDSAGHRRYLRVQMLRKAERMNKSGANVTVHYQEIGDDGLWHDVGDPVTSVDSV